MKRYIGAKGSGVKRVSCLAIASVVMTACFGGFGVSAPEREDRIAATFAQSYRAGSFTIEAQWDSMLVVSDDVKTAGDFAIQWWTDVLAMNELPSLADVPAWRFQSCGVDVPLDENADMVVRLEASHHSTPSAVVSCRRTAGLPFAGVIRLPRTGFADSVAHEPDADFVRFVVRHEMAHMLGFGYWLGGEVITAPGSIVVGGGRYFAGDSATAMYRRLTGKTAPYGVPLDNNRVRVSNWHRHAEQSDHWRLSALPFDIMVPYYLPRKRQAVSGVTLAALVDLGWQVDMSFAEVSRLPK